MQMTSGINEGSSLGNPGSTARGYFGQVALCSAFVTMWLWLECFSFRFPYCQAIGLNLLLALAELQDFKSTSHGFLSNKKSRPLLESERSPREMKLWAGSLLFPASVISSQSATVGAFCSRLKGASVSS